MLILNDYKCNHCGEVSEELLSPGTKTIKCPTCSETAYLAITKAHVAGCDFFNPHYDLQLGQHFESKAQKDDFLLRTGRSQLAGNPSPKRSTEGRTICTKSQAKNL